MATYKNSAELAAEGNEVGARVRGFKETAIEAMQALAPAELVLTDWEEVLHCIRGVPTISDDGAVSIQLTIKRGQPYDCNRSKETRSLMPFAETAARVVVEILAKCEGFNVEYGDGFYEDKIATLRFQTPANEHPLDTAILDTRSEANDLNLVA